MSFPDSYDDSYEDEEALRRLAQHTNEYGDHHDHHDVVDEYDDESSFASVTPQDRIDKLEEDLRLAGQIGQMLMKQSEEAQKRIKELEDLREEEQDKFDNTLSNFDYERAEFERNNRRLKLELDESREAIESLQGLIDEHASRIKELENEQIEQRIRNESEIVGIKVVDPRVQEQDRSEELSDEIQRLKIEHAQEVNELEEQKRSHVAALKKLHERIEQYDKQMNEAEEIKKQTEEMVENLKNDLLGQGADREHLERENRELSNQVEKLTVDIFLFQSRYDEVNRLYENQSVTDGLVQGGLNSPSDSNSPVPESIAPAHALSITAPSPASTSMASLLAELSPVINTTEHNAETGKRKHRHKKSHRRRKSSHHHSNSKKKESTPISETSETKSQDSKPSDLDSTLTPTSETTNDNETPTSTSSTGKRKSKHRKSSRKHHHEQKDDALKLPRVETDPRKTVFHSNAASEFFVLTFMAARLNYTMHPRIKQDEWPLPRINSQELYEKACRLGIPFHKYNSWVFQELCDMAKKYKERREKRSKRQKARKEQEQRYERMLAGASSQTPMALYTEQALNSYKQSEQKVKTAKSLRKTDVKTGKAKRHKRRVKKKAHAVALDEYVHESLDATSS